MPKKASKIKFNPHDQVFIDKWRQWCKEQTTPEWNCYITDEDTRYFHTYPSSPLQMTGEPVNCQSVGEVEKKLEVRHRELLDWIVRNLPSGEIMPFCGRRLLLCVHNHQSRDDTLDLK